MKDQSNNTLFIGKVAIRLATVDSTNQFAHSMLSKSSPTEGTVIRADEQYAGRGQVGSSWHSAPCQNITISVILRPKFLLAKQQFVLNAAMALGVYDFINQFDLQGAPLSIKWPNDIYIGEKKVSGMLIENILRGSYLDASIVGIGINVNQELFDPVLPNPTSLFLSTKKKYDLNEILFQLYACLERQYLRIQGGTGEALLKDYTQHLFRVGILATYRIAPNQTTIEGVIEGVDESGRLLVRVDNSLEIFDLKQISPVF